MIIDDRRKPIENLLLQSSVKTGILNRDKMRGKISLAGRIGTKFVQKRLDKREGVGISGISTSKKSGSIRDRLG